jgi:hypothetical protein
MSLEDTSKILKVTFTTEKEGLTGERAHGTGVLAVAIEGSSSCCLNEDLREDCAEKP